MNEKAPKLPPQNLEAESALLGAILIDNDSINRVMDVVTPTDFYREAHRRIYEAMMALSEKNEPTDILTVSNLLQAEGALELAGGASYLASMADNIPSSANIVSYARIVREKALLRKLIEAASQIATSGYENSDEPDKVLDNAEKLIFEISQNHMRNAFSHVKDIVKDSFKRIEFLFENQKSITGLATGLNEFDNMTSGLQPGDLIIIAARPSMGKTSLALNMAENVAIHEKGVVALFSLEMGKEQLVTRMLCSQARIDSSRLRCGQLEERDWPMLTKAAGHLSEANLYIDDQASPTVLEMRAKARRLKKERGLNLVIVDYLQLVRGSYFSGSREQEISEISRGLKALAKELRVPVIALSQLNRAVESRTNRRPQLSDLRESGAIEQDADVIAFIYRDEVYDPNTADKGIAEIIIGKQRNGPTGVCRAAFLNSYTKFENLAFEPQGSYVPPADEAAF
ncbi:MAG TPA: replicative DNA helicase [Deltaproteobacteria bacterium]|nr:MAG: replicative DNA helicase [Deltaproteobacteria bacterium GWA2_45_12]HBF12709.1 replicative DNA helicase [Deltaproteobacteria bacterium]